MTMTPSPMFPPTLDCRKAHRQLNPTVHTEFDIIQQNLQGAGRDLYKLEALASQCNTSERNQVYLIQETKIAGKENTTINECTFFLHGNDKRERRAGVGIMLGKEVTTA